MDYDSSPLVGTVILCLLLILDCILAAANSALRNCGDAEFEEALRDSGKEEERLRALKDNPADLTHALWLFRSLTGICMGFAVLYFARYYPLWAVCSVLLVLCYLVVNSVPSVLGRKNPEKKFLKLYGIAGFLIHAALPFTYVLTALTNCIVRLFGVDPSNLETEVTEDEIISMVNEGHEQGVLDEREAKMIRNIFELDDKQAEDIMIHRKNIIAISGTVNLRDAISFMVEQSVSRFPVYEDSIDNILGILHFRDAMKFHTMERYDDWLVKDIPELLRICRFVPRTRDIDLLFKNMQAEKLQLVIVLDEYGQTAGLVTMEDILEEIVGNIQDEYDPDENFIRQGAEGSYLMDGMTPLSEAEEVLGISFEENFDTLNGFLISRLNRIPSEDEQPEIHEYGYLFRIIKVENNTVSKVQIRRSEEEKENKEKEEKE